MLDRYGHKRDFELTREPDGSQMDMALYALREVLGGDAPLTEKAD